MSTSIDIGKIRKEVLSLESKINPLARKLVCVKSKKETALKKFEESISKIDSKLSLLQAKVSEPKELFSCEVNLEIPIIFKRWTNWSEADGDPHWRSQDNIFETETDVLVIKNISIFFQKKAEQRAFYKKENVYLSLTTKVTNSQKFSTLLFNSDCIFFD